MALAAAAVLAGCGGRASTRSTTTLSTATASTVVSSLSSTTTITSTRTASPPMSRAPFAVGERIVTLVDRSRTVHYPGHAPGPRTLVTIVRYPTARAAGPFPLIVFGHGFAVTPTPYARLLRAWARAGYVVAAPVFPLENAHAPGGPNESDLVNQPRDMSFVISSLATASRIRGGFFERLIDPHRVAVAGQSDGGETALGVAYDVHFLDRRIRAAVILSGAEIPGVGGFVFPAPSPPLLATQGTADTINPPSFTDTFFALAPPPKYLLTMFGASHLPPYTDGEPQLGIVSRVTIAFLDRYLNGRVGALRRMTRAGDVAGVSHVTADP